MTIQPIRMHPQTSENMTIQPISMHPQPVKIWLFNQSACTLNQWKYDYSTNQHAPSTSENMTIQPISMHPQPVEIW